jgi:riboflavin synthase
MTIKAVEAVPQQLFGGLMFSGIVEEVGTIRATREMDGARELEIEAKVVLEDLQPGSSVSLDGACHTVVDVLAGGFTVNSVGTTLSRTVAADYTEGSPVNLERAVAMGTRLDGHLVQGHVDAVGGLIGIEDQGEYRLLDFRIPSDVASGTILHGSITLNGVSLTVNAISDDDVCQVAVIPYTWEHTNLSRLEAGARVNVEGDLIGKYVRRLLSDGS